MRRVAWHRILEGGPDSPTAPVVGSAGIAIHQRRARS
jgi:hypothetical protein